MRGWMVAALLSLLATGPGWAQGHGPTPPTTPGTAGAPAVKDSAQEHSHEGPAPPKMKWSFDGPFGTFDRAALQRGYQVYKEVCANCHSMHLLSYRNLNAIGLSDEQVKALAATASVATTDDAGQPAERPALPSDRFKSPFPNEKAARSANGGALPPDLSLIIKAREDGSNYVHAVLNGYKEPPAGMKVPDGQYYNEYFPGHMLAMPKPLADDQVTYMQEGMKSSVEQMSQDVVQFLTWASNPEMEARKRMGIKAILFLTLMTGLTYAVKKKVWKDVH